MQELHIRRLPIGAAVGLVAVLVSLLAAGGGHGDNSLPPIDP
jgi:hypothetical protein